MVEMMRDKTFLEIQAETRIKFGWVFERFCQGEDAGQSLIEFAFCLPLILLVVTGIMTFGIAMNQYMQLTEAVSAGARQFAVSRGSQTDPCAAAVTTIAAAAPTLVKANLGYSMQVYSNSTSYSTYTTSCSSAVLYQGTPLVVTVTYPCNMVWYGVNKFKTGACTLTARTTEVVQ